MVRTLEKKGNVKTIKFSFLLANFQGANEVNFFTKVTFNLENIKKRYSSSDSYFPSPTELIPENKIQKSLTRKDISCQFPRCGSSQTNSFKVAFVF